MHVYVILAEEQKLIYSIFNHHQQVYEALVFLMSVLHKHVQRFQQSMKISILIFFFTFKLFSYTANAQVDNQTRSKMFCAALRNLSTAPNYVVVIVKNLNTGKTKEICTEAPFIDGAVSIETNVSKSINCMKYKDRYFEFKNDSALWNIGIDLYDNVELDQYARTLNITKAVKQVRDGKLTEIGFPPSGRKQQRMFAHLMFNNGVMMTRGCIAGNICGLTYFK